MNLPAPRKSARKRNTGRREAGRDYLTGLEVGKLIAATRGSRNEARDRCLLLLIFRHGLRVSEACRLKLDQVDTRGKVLHITRLKRGFSTTHPLRGDELKAIGAWLRQRARMQPSCKTFFVSEQRKPLHRSTVNLMLRTCKQGSRPALLSPSPHAAPRLRLRSCRPGSRHQAHSGLSRAPEHSAHRQVYRRQSRALRKVVAVNSRRFSKSRGPSFTGRLPKRAIIAPRGITL
jgi:integrase